MNSQGRGPWPWGLRHRVEKDPEGQPVMTGLCPVSKTRLCHLISWTCGSGPLWQESRSDAAGSGVTQVHRVFPSGLASREGTIQKGNEVLSINGKSLKGATHNDALAILRQARDPRQAVIVTRRPTLEAAPDLGSTADSAASASGAGDTSTESSKFSPCGGACGPCCL